MSGYYNQSDSDNGEAVEDNSGRGLRAQLENALKKIEKLERENQTKTATDLLKDKGIDPALADLIPSDTDPAEWVEKYGPLLGAKQAKQMEEPQEQPEVIAPAQDDPAVVAEREALEQMGSAEATGSPSVVSKDAMDQLEKVTSEEDLMKLIRQSQGQAG